MNTAVDAVSTKLTGRFFPGQRVFLKPEAGRRGASNSRNATVLHTMDHPSAGQQCLLRFDDRTNHDIPET